MQALELLEEEHALHSGHGVVLDEGLALLA
jgi:hypothetical protein